MENSENQRQHFFSSQRGTFALVRGFLATELFGCFKRWMLSSALIPANRPLAAFNKQDAVIREQIVQSDGDFSCAGALAA
jgi:hypothetical protein